MELLGSNIKKFQKTETLLILTFQCKRNRTFQSTSRKFIIFQETKAPKKCIIYS